MIILEWFVVSITRMVLKVDLDSITMLIIIWATNTIYIAKKITHDDVTIQKFVFMILTRCSDCNNLSIFTTLALKVSKT